MFAPLKDQKGLCASAKHAKLYPCAKQVVYVKHDLEKFNCGKYCSDLIIAIACHNGLITSGCLGFHLVEANTRPN